MFLNENQMTLSFYPFTCVNLFVIEAMNTCTQSLKKIYLYYPFTAYFSKFTFCWSVKKQAW